MTTPNPASRTIQQHRKMTVALGSCFLILTLLFLPHGVRTSTDTVFMGFRFFLSEVVRIHWQVLMLEWVILGIILGTYYYLRMPPQEDG